MYVIVNSCTPQSQIADNVRILKHISIFIGISTKYSKVLWVVWNILIAGHIWAYDFSCFKIKITHTIYDTIVSKIIRHSKA